MPLVTDDLLIYSFGGIDFGRASYNLGDPEWVQTQAIRQIDQVLDSSTSFRDYGGTQVPPFQFIAAFATRTARNSMLAKVGNVGTLAKSTTGQAITLMLTQAAPVQPAAGLYAAQLSFE